VYNAYFVVKLGDQDKSRALHKVCYVCVEDLKKEERKKESVQI
jgi:rRNA processing protein Gar1